MTEVDFYALSRAVQDSLLDSMSGQFQPAPLVARGGPRKTALAWLGVSVVAALALAIIAGLGYGELASPLALPPIGFVGAYAALGALVAVGAVNALAARARVADLPFTPGIYVFPACLVDARRNVLRVHPVADLKEVRASGSRVALAFPSGSFSFSVATEDEARDAATKIEAARDQMRGPIDEAQLPQLDPLAAPSVASPLTPDIARIRETPKWERQRIPYALLAGAAVGAILFFARDVGSDGRCLAWARAKNDVASYQMYLDHGRRHKAEVAEELLPRAALRAAIAEGSVEAIDAFSRAYPKTRITAEIAVAREAAMNAELDRASQLKTFAGVLGFGEKYPEHRKDAGFERAKHALYERALEHTRKETQDGVADVTKKLFTAAEKTSPKKTDAGYRGLTVEIRLRRLPSKDIERSDDLVRKSPMFNGVTSLPSAHLDNARFAKHEKELADAIATALGKAFDPEIVVFSQGARLEDGDGKLPDPKVPTLFVSYRVESSGAALAIKKPRGIFLGLAFLFNGDFAMPGDAHPLHQKIAVLERIPAQTLRDASGAGPAGALEAQVYEQMSHDAFAEFRDRYLTVWLKKVK